MSLKITRLKFRVADTNGIELQGGKFNYETLGCYIQILSNFRDVICNLSL